MFLISVLFNYSFKITGYILCIYRVWWDTIYSRCALDGPGTFPVCPQQGILIHAAKLLLFLHMRVHIFEKNVEKLTHLAKKVARVPILFAYMRFFLYLCAVF